MNDLFEYLKWRGDLTFTQDPPNAVDALIFSALSYLSFGGSVVIIRLLAKIRMCKQYLFLIKD